MSAIRRLHAGVVLAPSLRWFFRAFARPRT